MNKRHKANNKENIGDNHFELKKNEHRETRNLEPKINFSKNSSKKFMDFVKSPKFYRILIILALIVIPIVFSIQLRIKSYNLTAISTMVKKSTEANYLNKLKYEIRANNPYLAASPSGNNKINSEAQALFDKNFPTYWNQHKQDIEQEINSFKNRFRDKNGVTYLMAIDPYFYLRAATNLLKHGYTWDIYYKGYYYNLHAFGGTPIQGRFRSKHKIINLLPVIEVGIYKFLHFFGYNVELMYAAFITPIFLMIFATLVAFLIGKRIAGYLGGFFSAMIIAIHPFILTRTIGGFADTDAFNILFPLLISWLFIESLESKKFNLRSLIYASLAGVTTFIYSLAWVSWWFISDFLMLSVGLYFIYKLIVYIFIRFHLNNSTKNNKLKTRLRSSKNSLILIIAVILIYLFSAEIFFAFYNNNIGGFFNSLLSAPKAATHLKSIGYLNFWPNVFTTVAELNPGNWNQIFLYNGGRSLFILVLLGILILPLFMWLLKIQSNNLKEIILVYIWLFSTIYATFIGVRFILLLAPAFALAYGATAGWTNKVFSKLFKNEFEISTKVATLIVFSLFLLLIFLPNGIYSQATKVANSYSPNMDDTWYNLLTNIKLNSKQNSIINSWWDFGHWFKYVADRNVTLDGADQNNPQAYWLGRALTTSNELDSAEVLRYLDCGGNYGFKVLNDFVLHKLILKKGFKNITNFFKSPNISIEDKIVLRGKAFKLTMDMLNKIIPMNRSEAEQYLIHQNLTKHYLNQVLNYTKCHAPEDFFITSQDMIGKAGVWAHLGSTWNFSRAIYWALAQRISDSRFKRALLEDFHLNKKQANNILYKINDIKHSNNPSSVSNSWIAPWPSYLTSSLVPLKVNNNSIELLNSGILLSQYSGPNGIEKIVLTNISFSKNNLTNITAYAVVVNGNSIAGLLRVSFNKLYVAENNTYYSYKLSNAKKSTKLNIDILLYHPKINSYSFLLAQPPLADSTFTKLFYLNGYGEKYFKMFDMKRDVFGSKIIVWKLKWPFNNN